MTTPGMRLAARSLLLLSAVSATAWAAEGPQAYLVPGEPLTFPAPADSNSPLVREPGGVVVFNSVGHPVRGAGASVYTLQALGPVALPAQTEGGHWLESVVRAPDGTFYGYYHNEPPGVCPEDSDLTAPQIGAARSRDAGATWEDLGVILTAAPGRVTCGTPNAYFAGGVGDFSVVLDRSQQWLYFFFSIYGGAPEEQGVGVARLSFAERDQPVGKVDKFDGTGWNEPGLGGLGAVTFPVFVPWEDPETDAFWGPSVHWNAYLDQYVMLLNRSVGIGWQNEGIYVSFGQLEDPLSWSEPKKILDGGDWYPQVVGEDAFEGTDTQAGRSAFFFLGGRSDFHIVFDRPAASATSARAGVQTAADPSLRTIPRAEPTRARRRPRV